MDFLEALLLKLTIPTSELNSQLLQELLATSRKITQRNETVDKILDKLWKHMTTKLTEFDDQLLCSTCFFTILTYSKNQNVHYEKVHQVLNSILLKKEVKETDDVSFGMILMYGLFQSSYLTKKDKNCDELLKYILEITFRLLMSKSYEYSQYTFIAFKTISSFKKIVGTNFQPIIFNRNNQITLLNVINHNWENPITGVRNLNRIIFQTLLYVMDKDIYDTILKEINDFYWNKAKFLMLTEIIEQSQTSICELLYGNNWIKGLIYSLHRPGLVSCGSDMYYAILKKLRTDEEWCKIFLKDILNILNGETNKAIDNFYNYWCLITLKKFPILLSTLLNELSKLTDTETKLLSCLSVMKQGNKIALLERTFEIKKYVSQGLLHSNPQIRTRAFDVICVSHGKCLPNIDQYNEILDFLFSNVNSDCTVLRINMINSFSSFMTYLHNAFIDSKIDNNLEDLKVFCMKLQNLLGVSLSCDGNYQRKITTVKLIDITIKHLNEIPCKKRTARKCFRTLIDFLKTNNLWTLSDKNFILKLLSLLKDPADDVRQAVLHLLLNYYSSNLKSPEMFNFMMDDVIKCTKSKFFYDIDCGKIIFKLIVTVTLRDKELKKVEDYFVYWYDQIIEENNLNRNIVDSIHEGKQLHAILGLLFTIFETSLQYGYKLDIEEKNIYNFLIILNEISNQFMGEDEGAVSFDFSKMNDLVESLITKSSTTLISDNDSRISGLHQVVLNCLWLNVKIACDISSLLITYYAEDENICSKCLQIIVHVLETCRHKGAIEAAGTALGKSIQYLTSLPLGSNITKLPFDLLERKLKELIFETNKMASVTRRGAGLSIMVHKIVSSDIRKGKPLFHYFMNILLSTCMNSKDTSNAESVCCNNERDLPKAVYIHFLTKIVTDSSLASEMMYYSARLAELAFGSLTSPDWQIRNAALQLYGALVPKLIGQKKASGVDEETVATVACDEFRTHSPNLWVFILTQLDKTDNADLILNHSNFVPILNIIANLARRYNFTYDLEENENYSKLMDSLKIFLGSPIYTVRRLVSSCIINIYSHPEIYRLLAEYNNISENSLHGVMMLMKAFFKVYRTVLSDKMLCNLVEKYVSIFHSEHSYLSRAIFLNIFSCFGEFSKLDCTKICREVKKNMYKPGVFIWSNTGITIYIKNATWIEIADNLQCFLNNGDVEIFSKEVCTKIEHGNEIPENVLLQIANALISSDIVRNSYAMWKFLYKLSDKFNFSTLKDSDTFHNLLFSSKSYYRIRYFIPFATKVLINDTQNDKLLRISQIIYTLCDPSTTDTDMRHIAAIANNQIGAAFFKLPDDIKINSIQSAIILLQDEDEEIRLISTIFYCNINNEALLHAFICLRKIMSKEFMDSVLIHPKRGVQLILRNIQHFIASITITSTDTYNPFVNDSKNIYLEQNILKQLLLDLSRQYE